MPSTKQRLASIDVFRALTMLLMIFVNDLWTLTDVPKWLEHAAAEEDRMGFADIIFPAFLFIVGLSIPFAKKDLKNILWRTLALLVMGFFLVNMESYNDAAALLPRPVWMILMVIAFFIIWLDYRKRQWVLQGVGVALLIFLAIAFNAPMRPYWWGILGLIGWAYLFCALVYLFGKANLWVMITALIAFNVLNIFTDYGSCAAITMAGVVAALIYKQKNYLLLFGVIMLAAGFAIRPWEGISKIRATPAWVMICTGISIFAFYGLLFVKREIKIIKPAGTSTLTAYLLPYLYYGIIALVGIRLPEILRTGIIGLVKSLCFAFLIILLTGLLEKKHIRLKI